MLFFCGCASVESLDPGARRFFDTLNRYPGSEEGLTIPNLGSGTLRVLQGAEPRDVVIMVHPAYSLFFREEKRAKYSDAKYELLARQFEDESRFISDSARAGKIVILIVPGSYEIQSPAPRAYTSYLNTTAGKNISVFYLFSETSSSGTISMNEMVNLYRFLAQVKATRVLIGGGYIGRCQREFYTELTSYFQAAPSYVVPEISTISPEDISDEEAASILDSIKKQDYGPVRKFMNGKLSKNVNILDLPR